MKPVISIIVPVYNVEKYLDRCIKSLLTQTFKDFEIILVDDGSPDRCGSMCDEYAKVDSRIRVIHQENQGQSVARNRALDIAEGDYIMFVDSDDWVDPDFCRIPYQKAIEYNADCVMFKYIWVENDQYDYKEDYDEGLKTKYESLELINGSVGLAPWNKLYKKKLFDDLRFPEGRVYEDIVFTPQVVHRSDKTYFFNDSLYFYCANGKSSTKSMTHKANKDLFEMSMERISCYQEWGYSEMAEECMRWPCWTYLVREGRHGEYSDKCLEYLVNLPNGATNFQGSKRIMYYALKRMPILFDLICIITGRRTHKFGLY